MPQFEDIGRSAYAHLELNELLRQKVSVMLGVSATAEQALAAIGIQTVFDLGTSTLFEVAREASSAAVVGTTTARFGIAPSDWLHPNTSYASLESIGGLGIESLRGLDAAGAAALKKGLDVDVIRELASWPPQRCAARLVSQAMGSSLSAEEEQTEQLRPRMGEYPTERNYYSSMVMLQMQGAVRGLTRLDKPIALNPATGARAGFDQPAIGALLTLSQSWYAQGITLGHLLHCLALAPGEATRIAVIDWTRRTRTTSSESISESEELDAATTHARALSEVQKAVASEMQQGGSSVFSTGTSHSEAAAGSAGSGLLSSLFVSGEGSLSLESGTTSSSAQSASWSSGKRSVVASMTQRVNDRTEQHASTVRNRRASAVREVAQSEHEQVSTRIVANYNHMHALTIQYYEVVQIYRVATRIHQAERLLFIPMALVDFSAPAGLDLIERFRGALVKAALTGRARSLLLDDSSSIAVSPTAAVRVPTRLVPLISFKPAFVPSMGAADVAPVAQHIVGFRTWDARELASLSNALGRLVVRQNSHDLFVPFDTEIIGVSFAGFAARNLRFDSTAAGATPTTVPVSTDAGYVELGPSLRLADIESIHLAKADDSSRSGTMILHCSHQGRRFSMPSTPVELGAGTQFQQVMKVKADRADRQKELTQHLKDNQAHYSRAIFLSLDPSMLLMLLSDYEWNGSPLVDQIEPKPLTVSGNYLVFRAPLEESDGSGVKDRAGQPLSWGALLKERGVVFDDMDERLIPIPTGGVFGEAVLGRSNAAEKLDITRFWNWQDSPIPLTPTEIAPITTGTRGTPEDLKPGALGAPVLNIVNPTSLPDPAGLGAVLGAVASSGMFRDMGGLQGTQSLAQAASAGTLKAATEAGQLVSENLRTNAQKSIAMGQIAADLAKSVMSAMTGVPMGSSGPVAGISGEGAKINHGRDLDERGIPGTPAEGGSGPSSLPSGGSPAGDTGTHTGTTLAMNRGSGRYSHEASYSERSALGYSPAVIGATLAAYPTGESVAPAPPKTRSGAEWVIQFPGSSSLDELETGFKENTSNFIAALKAAGAAVHVSATHRPEERAYLMHWAWEIAKNGADASLVPPKAGVGIEWWHGDAATSKQGAQEMVDGFGIGALGTSPALASRHTQRRAVDMTISWTGNLDITVADGTSQQIASTPRTGANPELIAVGAGFGLLHFSPVASDIPHWSTDGK